MSHGSTRAVRIGVIGCGNIAYWVHLRILQNLPGAKLAAASEPDPQARARAQKIVRVPIIESSDDLLARDDIDAVVICAPTHLHAELSISALQKGKHVFVEKPIATTALDSRKAVEAAEIARVSAMVGFNRRLHPLFEQARAFIRKGGIGRVRAAQSAFCEPMPLSGMAGWRKSRSMGGGALLDLGSHHVDLFRWFLDDEIETVEAAIKSEESEHDSARVSLSSKGGTEIQSFFSYRTARADYLELIGEKGTLRIDRHEPTFSVKVGRRFGYGTRSRLVMPNPAVAAWRVRRLVRPSVEPSYRRALAAFVDSVRGKGGSVASFAEGARSLDVILAAEESAATHAPARVGE